MSWLLPRVRASISWQVVRKARWTLAFRLAIGR